MLPSSLTKRECGEEAEFCLQTTGTMGCCPDFVCSPAVNGIPFGGVRISFIIRLFTFEYLRVPSRHACPTRLTMTEEKVLGSSY